MNLPGASSVKQQSLVEIGEEIKEKRGTRGGPPPTTIQHLMYRELYINSKRARRWVGRGKVEEK